jgi:hypothetical protein
MKTHYYLFLIAFVALIALQSCKTKKKLVNANIKEFGNREITQEDTLLTLKYFLDDSTMFCFTEANINTIKQQIPVDKLKCFDFEHNWQCKEKRDVVQSIWACLGRDNVEKYLPVFEANSHSAAKDDVIKQKTESILKAVDTNQLLGIPDGTYRLTSIPNIPTKVKSIFQNYPLFYKVSGHYKIKTIGSIHNGEVVEAASCINFAYNTLKQKQTISIEDRFEALLFLMYGFDTKIEINSFNNVKATRHTHEIKATIDGNLRFYWISADSDAIASISELTENNEPIRGRSFNNK